MMLEAEREVFAWKAARQVRADDGQRRGFSEKGQQFRQIGLVGKQGFQRTGRTCIAQPAALLLRM